MNQNPFGGLAEQLAAADGMAFARRDGTPPYRDVTPEAGTAVFDGRSGAFLGSVTFVNTNGEVLLDRKVETPTTKLWLPIYLFAAEVTSVSGSTVSNRQGSAWFYEPGYSPPSEATSAPHPQSTAKYREKFKGDFLADVQMRDAQSITAALAQKIDKKMMGLMSVDYGEPTRRPEPFGKITVDFDAAGLVTSSEFKEIHDPTTGLVRVVKIL